MMKLKEIVLQLKKPVPESCLSFKEIWKDFNQIYTLDRVMLTVRLQSWREELVLESRSNARY